MRKVLAPLFIVMIVISSGCSYYRTCPTYTKEAEGIQDKEKIMEQVRLEKQETNVAQS